MMTKRRNPATGFVKTVAIFRKNESLSYSKVSLKNFFSRHVRCPNCGRGVENATLDTKGSVATIESLGCCDQPLRWQTQPFISSMAAGNLLLSAGILLTGNDYGNIANLAKATNIQFISQRNFSSTQKNYLFPIINKKFADHQVDVFNEVRNTEVVAGGDGCCDSPWHSARFGTYSIVDTASSKVLDFSLVKVTEVKNSNAMELEGLKRCLNHLQDERVVIAKLATDRHVQVRAHMKKERPHIIHKFDVWHLAKSVQKKLTKKLWQSRAQHWSCGFMLSSLTSGGVQNPPRAMLPSVWNDGNPLYTTRLISITGMVVSIFTTVRTHPSQEKHSAGRNGWRLEAPPMMHWKRWLGINCCWRTSYTRDVPWPYGKEVLSEGTALLLWWHEGSHTVSYSRP